MPGYLLAYVQLRKFLEPAESSFTFGHYSLVFSNSVLTAVVFVRKPDVLFIREHVSVPKHQQFNNIEMNSLIRFRNLKIQIRWK